jgi:hypothetical protein
MKRSRDQFLLEPFLVALTAMVCLLAAAQRLAG